jgi:hypothetical protein
MKDLPVIIEIHAEEYNRHITFNVLNLLNDSELQWRLQKAVEQLKRDVSYLERQQVKGGE